MTSRPLASPLDEHAARVLALGALLAAEARPLATARGLVLAADIPATIDLPPFDNAAMDGYAVRAAECAAPLAPVGTGAAGAGVPPPLGAREAARIMTGAPVPAGADAVVPVEATRVVAGRIEATAPVRPGANIRRAGEDVRSGSVVARAGDVLGAGRVALLAALGVTEVRVRRPPVVTVLATGSELTAPGQALPPGGIYESNAAMLAVALADDGADVRVPSHIRDDVPTARAVLAAAAAASDLVLTAGGISAGDFEVVREALGSEPEMCFGPVAITPGRPQGWGRLAGTPVVCLPGTPLGALVSYLLFAGPLVRALRGVPARPWPHVPLAADLPGRAGRTTLALARLDADGARPTGSRHLLSSLAAATHLLRVDGRDDGYAAGDTVPALSLTPE